MLAKEAICRFNEAQVRLRVEHVAAACDPFCEQAGHAQQSKMKERQEPLGVTGLESRGVEDTIVFDATHLVAQTREVPVQITTFGHCRWREKCR
jgi:hypothetical protein